MSFEGLMAKIEKAVQLWRKQDYYGAFDCLREAGKQFVPRLSTENLEKASQALRVMVQTTTIPEIIAANFEIEARFYKGQSMGDWFAIIASIFGAEAEKRKTGGAIREHIEAL